jgi:hypothetical protein
LPIERKFNPLHAIRREDPEYWVGGKHRENPRWRIDGKPVPLAQMQKPCHGVDVAAGDNYSGNRGRAQSASRMQYRSRLDLQAQIR